MSVNYSISGKIFKELVRFPQSEIFYPNLVMVLEVDVDSWKA